MKFPSKIPNSSPSLKSSKEEHNMDQRSSGALVVFKDVMVKINKKEILKNSSGWAAPGELLAIMGPSGAGKSTLLNVLGARIPLTSGSITINGKEISKGMRRKVSYVPQKDAFYPQLTLEETLTFHTMLRLPESMPYKLRMQRMAEVVDLLELQGCLQTCMGYPSIMFSGGLSGGERKRANIACELIYNPQILLIDEPTTGLDATIAYNIMATLSAYAKEHRTTILATIHQPSSRIFQLFSRELILYDGQVAYSGAGNKLVDYFSDYGLRCDINSNPVDFIINEMKFNKETWRTVLSQIQNGSNREYMKMASTPLDMSYNESDNDKHESLQNKTKADVSKYFDNDAKWQTDFCQQHKTLMKRELLLRKKKLSPITFIQEAVAMFVISFEWFQVERSEATFRDRLAIIYFTLMFSSIIEGIQNLVRFYDEFEVYRTERSSGIYRLSALYLAKITSDLPYFLVKSLVHSIVIYWMTGFSPDALNFFGFWLILMLTLNYAASLGFLIGVIARNRSHGVAILGPLLSICFLTGGFTNFHVKIWIVWIRYLSGFFYSGEAMANIEFTYGEPLKCIPPNITSFPEYCTSGRTLPGAALIGKYDMYKSPIYVDFIALLLLLLLNHTLSYLILRFRK